MALCNELAHRFECDQVSLGFLINNECIRLKAISQTAHFDKNSSMVRALEIVMEEAVDQEEEIVWPVPEGFTAVAREHEQYAREHAAPHLCTVPLRDGEKASAAICCEREARPFSEPEIRQISLSCELAIGRLLDLRRRDRWFLVRLVSGCREKLARLLGVEHTWAKLAGFLVSALLLTLLFIKAPYRVEAPFILKADKMAFLSVPFDGFIESVGFEIGDRVEAGKDLIVFDRKALLLEMASATATLRRHDREAEKKRAENRLADMRISEALAEQARARIALIDYRLQNSFIRAPFAGVIVEGDWKDKVNSAVRQGEALVRIAQLDTMYVELEIDAEDISRIHDGMTGEIAFISDPKLKYPVKLVRIRPAAVPKNTGPVFQARAECEANIAEWWRPGMSGLAKINVGRRSLWWIFSHRTEDFLRRKLWW